MKTSLITDYLYIPHRLESIAATKFLPRLRGRVLDVGCGYQPHKKMLIDCEYVGMDLDASRNPDIVGSVMDIPQDSESFDGVIFTEVIEHIPEPDDALREIARCLRAGGLLYITAPQSWGLHYVPHDYFRFTRFGLSYLLQKHGFKVISIDKVGAVGSLVSSALIAFIAERIILPAFRRMLRLARIRRGEYRLTAALLAPINLLLLMGSIVVDHFDSDNVLGWAILAEKGNE